MEIYDRKLKKTVDEVDVNANTTKKLYDTFWGRVLVKILKRPFVTKFVGFVLSRRISRVIVKTFIKKSKIDMSDYPERKYKSFNDFFTREIKEGRRPISEGKKDLIAPCDSLLTAYKISSDLTVEIKSSYYTVPELLKDEKLAKEYNNGYLMLFFLTPRDYHHYCYLYNGTRDEYKKIKGVFHTLNPLACKKVKVYAENTREYTVIHSENFGDVVSMEVGALLVGKMRNNSKKEFKKGEEKGYFEYGASSIVLLFKEGTVEIDKDILTQTAKDIETRVKYGEKVGKSLLK